MKRSILLSLKHVILFHGSILFSSDSHYLHVEHGNNTIIKRKALWPELIQYVNFIRKKNEKGITKYGYALILLEVC